LYAERDVNTLITDTANATLEYVKGVAEGMKRRHYNEEQPFLKHRNDFNDAYNHVIDDLIARLTSNQ
jgi:hypothetical protein